MRKNLCFAAIAAMLAMVGCKKDTGGVLPDKIDGAEIAFATESDRIVAATRTTEIPVVYKTDGNEVTECPYTLSLKALVPLKAADMVREYNERGNTDFVLLPEGCYKLKAGTIEQGSWQASVSLIIDRGKVRAEYKGWPFLLPLRLAANDTKIKSEGILYIDVPTVEQTDDVAQEKTFSIGDTPATEASR